MPNCLISVELYTSYYAQMWRPCTGTNKSNNISMLNLPVIKIIKKKNSLYPQDNDEWSTKSG